MKYIILVPSIFLFGCTSFLPVSVNDPYDFPKSLLEECKEPELLIPEGKFSDNLKVIIDNNTKATECRVTKKALNELIQKRKETFNQ